MEGSRGAKEGKQPPKSSSLLTIVFFALSALSFVAIFIIPEVHRHDILSAALDLDDYTLRDVVHPSLYKETARSGDTTPTLAALFHATNILREAKKPLADDKKVKAFLASKEDTLQTTADIYHFTSAAVFARSLTAATGNRLYEKLEQLIEPAAGFIPAPGGAASVTASWQALESISFLGKIDVFKSTSKFNNVIRFVRSMKNPHNESGARGFSEEAGHVPTLTASYHAHRLLSKYDTFQDTDQAGYVEFLYSCQSADGGFLDHSVHDNHERYYTIGALEQTAQAVRTILTLTSVDLRSLFLPFDHFAIYNAVSFLRSCASTEWVKSRPHDYFGSLSAADELVSLMHQRPDLHVETPRNLQLTSFGAALFFLSLALHHMYKDRLGRVRGFDGHNIVHGSAALLLAFALVLKFAPNLSVLPLVFLAGFLLKVFYHNLEDLFKTGEDTVLALALGSSALFGLFPFAAVYLSPLAFTQMSIYYVLSVWGPVGVFLSLVIAKQFLGNTKAQSFYYSAATMTWILNTLILYSLLYSRGVVSIVHHLVSVSGNAFSVYVALPLLSLVLIYISVNVGLSMFPGTPLVAPKKK
jgi:hypothetical protein